MPSGLVGWCDGKGQSGSVGGGGVGEEGGGEQVVVIAEGAGAGGEFRAGVAIGGEEVEGRLESLLVGRWEEGEGGGAGGGCEEECFFVAELDASRVGGRVLKALQEVGDISIVEESIGVIMVGEAVGLGLLASGGSGSDVGVELAEDEVEGKGGEGSAKGASPSN